jgi:hypothetical protein
MQPYALPALCPVPLADPSVHAQINGDKPALIQFWGLDTSPIFGELSEGLTAATFYRVNVNKVTDVSRQVGAHNHSVRGACLKKSMGMSLMNMQLPMFIAYKNGKKIDEMAGVNNQSAVAVRALSLFPLLLLLTILYRRHRLFITLLASDLCISHIWNYTFIFPVLNSC